MSNNSKKKHDQDLQKLQEKLKKAADKQKAKEAKREKEEAKAAEKKDKPKLQKKGRFAGTDYPYEEKLKNKEYEADLLNLQVELLKAQIWIKEAGERVVIIFEGQDAAGKGGTIKRFTEHLNPRGARVVALLKPNDAERGEWYYQRYIAHLPTAGEIVFFDRSWYNRAGVEPVMGYCTPAQYREFMRQTPQLERGLVNDGIRMFKLWFAVDQAEQLRRFQSRMTDPLKQWKLSPTDIESIDRYDDYALARDRMFFMTHTKDAPWTVIRSDDKKRARLNAIRHFLSHLPYADKDEKVVQAADPKIAFSPDAADPTQDEFANMINAAREY